MHDQNDLDQGIQSIIDNPSKAGLKEWPRMDVVDRKFGFSTNAG